jgi:hypothetical protein
MRRYISKTRLDEFDWYEMFAKFRDEPDEPHVALVFRILELLKKPLTHRTHSELRALLSHYEWHSNVSPSTRGPFEVLQPPLGLSGLKAWEYEAVRWLLNLLRERGELDLVHKCSMYGMRPGCLGWFYARKYGDPEKRFCSPACKSYKHDSEPEVKARRARNAKYNIDFRKREKEKDERAKRAVGFGRSVSRRAKKS